MNRKLLVLLLLLITLTSKPVLAKKEAEVIVPEQVNPANEGVEAKKLDNQAKILSAYFAKYDSPLQNHSQDFIDAAKKYNLDWRLVAAISGVESTFGKAIPGGYNGWGWGVYGNQTIYFNSWTEGIFTISKGIRENYIDKGLTEPYAINRIYATSPTWGSRVSYFMEDIEKFASHFEGKQTDLPEIQSNPQIAAISATLASRSEPVLR